MKNKLTVLVLAFVAVLSLNSFKENKTRETKVKASASIGGFVIDEQSGETLVGVEVKLEGTGLKTYTDFDGNFVFDNVKEGVYVINTQLVSYKEVKEVQAEVKACVNKKLQVKMRMDN